MGIKSFIRKMILGSMSDSQSYIDHLRSVGAKIGERTTVYEPRQTFIDETRPFLVEIGDDVQITRGVTILTHGYDWSVLKGVYGEVLGSAGKVTIGNNVFIGMNTTILKGVTVGDNVIIGSNSLVNKDIPDNSVYAGNPAKFICTIEQYFEKRKEAQLQEAKCMYDCYCERYGKEPPQEIFAEFFWLFHPRNEKLPREFEQKQRCVGNFEDSQRLLCSIKPQFDGYEAFLAFLRG